MTKEPKKLKEYFDENLEALLVFPRVTQKQREKLVDWEISRVDNVINDAPIKLRRQLHTVFLDFLVNEWT